MNHWMQVSSSLILISSLAVLASFDPLYQGILVWSLGAEPPLVLTIRQE